MDSPRGVLPSDGPADALAPLAESDDPTLSAAVVWWSRLDDRYHVEVVRASGSAFDAELRVFDTAVGNRVLLREHAILDFGARFGPDVANVAAWQRRVVRLVDADSWPSEGRAVKRGAAR